MIERWRVILQDLVPEEKRRVIEHVGIDMSTLSRWSTGVSTPRKPEQLRKLAVLLDGMQEALLEVPEFRSAFDINYDEPDRMDVPPAYTADILGMVANTATFVRQYTIHNHVYQDILSQLDEHKEGMMLLFVQCVEPKTPEDKVTALQVHAKGRGTGPWKAKQVASDFLLGSGTLNAVSVARGEPALYPQDQSFRREAPLLYPERIQSVASFPLLRGGSEVAGALFVASVHAEFFTPTRIELIKTYANMFALGLRDNQFYPMERIELQPIPLPQHQSLLLNAFYTYMERVAERYPEYKDRSVEELERFAIQRLQQGCKKEEKNHANNG